MSFERFYHEIREKLGNEGQDLYNKDLLKKIHSHTLDIKWNFDKGREISEGYCCVFFQKITKTFLSCPSI